MMGVIRVIPIHPLPESLRLLGNDGGVFLHAGDAGLGEFVQAKFLDILFRGKAEFFLDLDLDP